MRKICIACAIFFSVILLFGIKAKAQERKISGIITESVNNTPLEGATIIVNNAITTLSGSDGRFTLNVPSQKVTLIVSYTGYEEKKMIVNADENTVKIKLSPASGTQLGEIVVVGVQRQTRRTSIASLSSLSGKDIENMPSASVDAMMQGRVAGLNVQITSGEPGIAPTVVVRGNSLASKGIDNNDVANSRALSSPLYVIDGVPVDPAQIDNNMGFTGTNYMAGINLNDIESIDVQKDAIAKAAWGSRGANGVIYIKTKRGKSTKPEFRVNLYSGIVAKPQFLYTLVGENERRAKLDIIRKYASPDQMANGIPQILTDSLNPNYNNATDWQNMFYRNGLIKNVDIGMSGASPTVNYRVGLNYYDEQGTIKSFGYTRYSFRSNFEVKITDNLTTQFLVSASRGDRKRGQKYYNSDDNTPVSGANQPASFLGLTPLDSSLFMGLSSQLRNKNITDNISASYLLNYKIFPFLRYSFQGSANINMNNRDYFQPATSQNLVLNNGAQAGRSSLAESKTASNNSYFVFNNLDFNKTLKSGKNDHDFSLTLSQQFSRDVNKSTTAGGYNTPNNNVQTVTGVAQADLFASSSYSASNMLSYVGQFLYDLNRKYLLSFNYRADASSRFGSNSKWGYFPSAGIGWIVSDEKFMEKLKPLVSFLKLKGSIGSSGQQSYDDYAPLNTYTRAGYYNGSVAYRPDYNNGLTKNNLTWARSIDKNAGIELQMFNSRLNINADIYDRLTKDGFYRFDLPFYTGFNSVEFNARDLWISNKGLDLTVGTINPFNGQKFKWNSQMVFSYNKNIIAKLPNNNRTFVISDNYGVSRIYAVGQPVYEMFFVKYLGVYNNESEIDFNPYTGKKVTYFKGNHTVQAGDPKWLDVNKDYDVWTDEDNGDQYGDRIPSGDPNPKFTGGLTNDFSYKNFNLNIICVYTFGRKVYNTYFQSQVYSVMGNINGFANNRLPDFRGINYWSPDKLASDPNYKADFPSINPFTGNYYQYLPLSDQFVENGNYFKVKTITLGYELPNSFLSRLSLKRARAYAMVTDVVTFKKSSMPNPELVNEIGVYTGGNFPTPIKVTLGIDITF